MLRSGALDALRRVLTQIAHFRQLHGSVDAFKIDKSLGHAGEAMTDLYDKIKEDVEFRKEWAEKCGIGFALPEFGPSVVPNVPKTAPNEKAAFAA